MSVDKNAVHDLWMDGNLDVVVKLIDVQEAAGAAMTMMPIGQPETRQLGDALAALPQRQPEYHIHSGTHAWCPRCRPEMAR